MKQWYRCPNCNKKIVKYEEYASCRGVFFLCKNCKKEIEVKIQSLNRANEPD